ncbi:MAG TPA: glycosyltransferase [Pseudomonadota bacterium]|nr:glycosyltransferase [Pseudomonadota bacterium]
MTAFWLAAVGVQPGMTPLLDTAASILTAVYAGVGLVFLAALVFRQEPTKSDYRPTVSVIVAAKDEESCIQACLSSLRQLSYPAELLEIIIVNDRSRDRTPDIVRQNALACSLIRLVDAAPVPGMVPGKASALAQGVRYSLGEVLLFTDADCTVPPDWVQATLKYYDSERVGIVAGFTVVRPSSLLAALQALDWLYLFSVGAAFLKLGIPQTICGNNFSIRRTAYDAVGGYENTPFSLTEDFALFHRVLSRTGMIARMPLDRETIVETQPCRDFLDMYRQKLRWLTGGRDMPFFSLLVFGACYVFHLSMLISVLFHNSSLAWLAPATKLLVDLLVVLPAMRRIRRWGLCWGAPLFLVYFTFYVLVYPLIVLANRGVTWKGQLYRSGHSR